MSNEVFTTLGGLGLFLMGMLVMTEGLKALAGESLHGWLMHFTRSPTSGAITVTLQAGEDLRQITIKNSATTGTNLVTVTPNGSDTVDGAATYPLNPLESIRISYDKENATWWVL